MTQTVAIIGYGTAAVNAIIALRTAGYRGKIQVFSDTATPPYSPMMTASYAVGTCDYEGMFPWDAADLDQLDVQVVAGAPVARLDVNARTVLAGGGTYSYDACLIASGAHPRRAAWEAASELPKGARPLVLRTLQDAEAFRAALNSGNAHRVLISGTSMVALKALDACLAQGVGVSLLGRGEHIMSRTACPEVASALEAWLAEKGVDVRLCQTIESVEPAEGNQVRVLFSNGDVADYGCLLLAHGVAPNVDFVDAGVFGPVEADPSEAASGAAAGAACACAAVGEAAGSAAGEVAAGEAVGEAASEAADEPFDFSAQGIPVDAFMRTSAPSVYAAGDVARVLDFSTGAQRVAGLWKEACLQGAAAGRAMAAELAGEAPSCAQGYFGFVPSNCITVGGAVVLSAGSVSAGFERWTEIVERNECLIAAVYERASEGNAAGEQSAGAQPGHGYPADAQAGMPAQVGAHRARLVGYNVFSKNADPATSFAYDEAAMLYRRLEAERFGAKGGCHE